MLCVKVGLACSKDEDSLTFLAEDCVSSLLLLLVLSSALLGVTWEDALLLASDEAVWGMEWYHFSNPILRTTR